MGYVADRLASIAQEAPQVRPGKVVREKTRHGKAAYYYREGKGRRIRLPDKDAVPEVVFRDACEAAANGRALQKPRRAKLKGPSSRPGQPGYVYFVRSKDAVKIGFTTNIRARITQIQTGNAENLELLMVMPATDETEKFLHRMFHDFRIGGEWFSLTGLLADFVGYSART